MAYPKWTQAQVDKRLKEGRGRGRYEKYINWVDCHDFPSDGVKSRIPSTKYKRALHLFSHIETNTFYFLEHWPIVEVREQYRLDVDATQEIARRFGIRHPCYPGGNVPTVMTADFLITFLRDGIERFAALNCKPESESEDLNSMLKLAIQEEYFAMDGIPHFLVFDSDIETQIQKNLVYLRDAMPHELDLEPYPGFFLEQADRMGQSLRQERYGELTLSDFCQRYDVVAGITAGTSIRIVKILMHMGKLTVKLNTPNLLQQKLKDVCDYSIDSTDEG